MKKIIGRKTCRVCGSKKLKSVFLLGNLFVSDFVKQPNEKGMRCPLELISCGHCTLLQLKHTAPQEILYTRHYWYRSGINPVIVKDLKEIVEVALKMVDMGEGDRFLDIGANDGTLLSFVPNTYFRIGVEPAKNLIEELKKNCEVAINDFWRGDLFNYKAKIITAIGMFYDMDDPGQFIRDAKKALTNDGIFIAQLMTLKAMLEKNDIGNICHEHLEFYSYQSLKELFERNGLEIFKVEENSINGGSYRLFARHYDRGSINYKEPKEDYKTFIKTIRDNKRKAVKFIKDAVRSGKKVYAFGASTKGNTVLQYYGLSHKWITGIADRNPEKYGKYTVGTRIPIVPESQADKEADYYFILPYAFLGYFKRKKRTWLKNGGIFIVSTPEFRLITR